jgi:hypothetical protein
LIHFPPQPFFPLPAVLAIMAEALAQRAVLEIWRRLKDLEASVWDSVPHATEKQAGDAAIAELLEKSGRR